MPAWLDTILRPLGFVRADVPPPAPEPEPADPSLAKCPFCGYAAADLEYTAEDSLSFVLCPHCGARGPSACSYAWGRDVADQMAIAGWNRRSRD
jgi:Lar family restriction alleviation protein